MKKRKKGKKKKIKNVSWNKKNKKISNNKRNPTREVTLWKLFKTETKRELKEKKETKNIIIKELLPNISFLMVRFAIG